MGALRLDLLGTRELLIEGARTPLPSQRHIQALVYVVAQKQWVARERLALLFWPDHPRAAAMRNVRKLVHLIGAMPWPLPFEARGDALRCLLATDVDAFEAALAADQRAAALDAYGGEFAPGLEADAEAPYCEWLQAERARLAGRWRAAVLAEAGTAGSSERALAWLERLVAADPLDEDALSLTLSALRAAGRAAQAQRLYRTFADRVARELGIEPSARLRALAAEASAPGAATGPSQADADVFVGRRLELRRIDELLGRAATRALLLHGPGGVGKSRLAREVLARAAPRFADGAHWVALEDAAGEAQVCARILQAVGLEYRERADAFAHLGRMLGSRHLLLVLDNAEHLPELGGPLVRLLAACARLQLVVTSRVVLAGLPAEVVSLSGLEVPDDESVDADAAGAFDAVHLFVERARFHQRSFALAGHVEAIHRIVRSVQGLPLAIEMAAAWVRLMPPAEIARELQASIDVLERDPAAGAPARAQHLSVRATLHSSWALLAPKERAVLVALAVFRGGFTSEAAQAVAGASLPLLASLVDKSLVQADRERGRFDLHPLVAAFCSAPPAAEAGDAADARARHAHHHARRLEQAGALVRSDPARFLATVAVELENCRAAWRDAVARLDTGDLGAMALPLGLYLRDSGRFAEGAALLAEALVLREEAPGAPAALAHVHRMIASLHWQAGQQDGVDRHARKGIRLARLAGDGVTIKSCLCTIGLSLEQRNRGAQARRYYLAALKRAEADGDPYWIAVACNNLGGLALQMGERAESLRHHQRVLAIHEDSGNVNAIAQALSNLGNHHRVCRQWAEAAALMRRGLALSERHGLHHHSSFLLVNLGLVELERGDGDAAVRCFQRTLGLEGRGATPWLIIEAKFGLARAAARRGDLATAWLWLDKGARQTRHIDHEHYQLEALIVFAELLGAAGDAPRAHGLLDAVAADRRADATLRDDAQGVRQRMPAPAQASAALPLDLERELDALLERAGAASQGAALA